MTALFKSGRFYSPPGGFPPAAREPPSPGLVLPAFTDPARFKNSYRLLFPSSPWRVFNFNDNNLPDFRDKVNYLPLPRGGRPRRKPGRPAARPDGLRSADRRAAAVTPAPAGRCREPAPLPGRSPKAALPALPAPRTPPAAAGLSSVALCAPATGGSLRRIRRPPLM